MREFNSRSISIVVGKYYHTIFPDRKGKISVISHGIRTEESPDRILNAFYCYDPNYGCIGFAVHFDSIKILRFYNHEGENVSLETEMIYKPLKKGKRTKIKH